jgi:hypothetical protein
MKPVTYLLAGLLLASSLQPAAAAGRKIDNVVPKVTLVGTPEVVPSIRGGQPKRPRPIVSGEPAPIWLEFESDFDAAEEFPELVFKYSLLLKIGQSLKLVEGEVTHIDIAKGKERHSVIYIAPKTLNRLFEGKAFTQTNIHAYWVEVYAAGELQGGNFKSTHGVTYDQVTKAKDTLEKIPDVFLTKSQTPFAPYFWDYYESVKPSTR